MLTISPSSDMGSPFLRLGVADFKKVLMGAAVAAVGAALAYILEYTQTVDFGEYQVFAAAGLAVLANLVRKLLSDTR